MKVVGKELVFLLPSWRELPAARAADHWDRFE